MHYDGYPEAAGAVLKHHYGGKAEVDALFDRAHEDNLYLSSLGPALGDATASEKNAVEGESSPGDDVACVWNPAGPGEVPTGVGVGELRETADRHGCDYMYVHNGTNWSTSRVKETY